MNDLWHCLGCEGVVTLDKHGRCSTCQSDAVVRRSLEHLALLTQLYPIYTEIEEMVELEHLWRKS